MAVKTERENFSVNVFFNDTDPTYSLWQLQDNAMMPQYEWLHQCAIVLLQYNQ